MLPVFDFRPIEKEYPLAFEKLKAWICEHYWEGETEIEPPQKDHGWLEVWNKEIGRAIPVHHFEPTLLPYFFDENGITGTVVPVQLRQEFSGDWETLIVNDVHRGVHRPSREEANHALWNRCFDILNQSLKK